MESLPSGRANSIPSGGWRSERPGARRRDDHVCEAMQLTCIHLPLPLCPIYLHRLCLFSDPANCPHRLRISSSSLFSFFYSPLPYSSNLFCNDRRLFGDHIPQHSPHSPKRQGMSSLQVCTTRLSPQILSHDPFLLGRKRKMVISPRPRSHEY